MEIILRLTLPNEHPTALNLAGALAQASAIAYEENRPLDARIIAELCDLVQATIIYHAANKK